MNIPNQGRPVAAVRITPTQNRWIAAAVLGLILSLSPLAEQATAQSISRTDWEMNYGSDGQFGSTAITASFHGDPVLYSVVDIPTEGDAGWQPAPLDVNGNIDFSEHSTVLCLKAANFTYFQTSVTIPTGTTLTEFKVTFGAVDDGARAYIFNSAHPSGDFVSGADIKLGDPPVTADLSSLVVVGETNRVVIAQVDDCASGNNLKNAQIVINGEVVPEVTDTDGDGIDDVADMCPATAIPDPVATNGLNPNHWRLSSDGFNFEQGSPKGKGKGSGGSYDLAATAGCSCSDIIEQLDLGKGHVMHGCSNSAMRDWTALINGVGKGGPELAFGLNESVVPTDYTLTGNYPNPFNPRTSIEFGLPESAHVLLVVYDLMGREVSVLVDGVLGAGAHAASFDATGLSTGTYIYRLTTPKGTQAKTMMLLK